MQIRITDLTEGCCPERAEPGKRDAELVRRIERVVFIKLNMDRRRLRRRNIIRTVLIAAVIAALMTVTAFAAGLFSMERHKVEEGEEVSGYWRFYDKEGNLTEQQEWTYPEASIVFTFYGPEEEYNMPEFRFGWLPEEGEHYEEQKSMSEGWMYSYGLMCQCDIIPCQAGVMSVPVNGYRGVLNGEATVLKEEVWDCWDVTEIQVDYSNCTTVRWPKPVNYIYMFDQERGYLAYVRGCDGMETLEKIARNMEIRESEAPDPGYGSPLDEIQIGTFDLGRG
ncbi:MAG TPA: hypothetical protein IAC00_02020 [Candidatus Limivicinus faecipullorum]|nr:hypothetical protein [Candidatus Limivicinus faecipullorum]